MALESLGVSTLGMNVFKALRCLMLARLSMILEQFEN